MEDYHTIITILSIIILLESLYIFSKKMKSSRSRRRGAEGFAPIYDDMGQGHAWDNQDYATLGM